MLFDNKKIIFLGFVLSFLQAAFADAGKIVLPGQKQEIVTEASVSDVQSLEAKPVSFVDAVENGQAQGVSEVKKNYADRVLQDDISLFGSLGRGTVKATLFAVLLAMNNCNFNIAYAGTALTDEALIAVGLFKDSKVFRFHKDATWWQWCKAGDSMLSGLPAEAAERDRPFKRISNVEALALYGLLAGVDVKKAGNDIEKIKSAAFGCMISYALADFIRKQMTNPEGSPRIANIISILLAGGMNELVKKIAY